MAEIAIPVVALGAMWLISNDKKKKGVPQEGFDNVSAPQQRELVAGTCQISLTSKTSSKLSKTNLFTINKQYQILSCAKCSDRQILPTKSI